MFTVSVGRRGGVERRPVRAQVARVHDSAVRRGAFHQRQQRESQPTITRRLTQYTSCHFTNHEELLLSNDDDDWYYGYDYYSRRFFNC